MAADRSDKWHHTMCRYLGLNQGTFFGFGILPGVCREALGRNDYLYTKKGTFNSNKVYAWSDYHYKRLVNQQRGVVPYYGTAPFLWELGKIAYAQENTPEFYALPAGSLFFLPRDDQCTIREEEYESVQRIIDDAPRPITFLVPWRSCDIWKHWDKLNLGESSTVIQMSDPETRQYTLATLLLQHEHIFIPWPGTDVYYAEFLDRQVHVYDDITKYRTKKPHEQERFGSSVLLYLKWGYDYLNDIQKEFFHLTEKWDTLHQQDRKFLTSKMLGLDVIKSPEVLYQDLFDNHFIIDGRFGSPIQSEYENAYLYLKEKVEKTYNSKCSQVVLDLYNKL
jgi:hypothetical protein